MDKPELAALRALFEQHSRGLPDVTKRKMFGCDAFFANGNIFGLIWKTGRIGVKLPDQAQFNELMAIAGSEPWAAGNKIMKRWVLVPETFHRDPKRLNTWIQAAHDLALSGDGT